MAKASVKIICAVCGKEFEHSKNCYNRAEADNYEQWAKSHIDTCPHCWAEAKREAEKVAAEKATAGIALVELTGSPKQVAWASDIRSKAVSKVVAAYSPNESFWTLVNSKSEAKWWIDNRGCIGDPVSFAECLTKED